MYWLTFPSHIVGRLNTKKAASYVGMGHLEVKLVHVAVYTITVSIRIEASRNHKTPVTQHRKEGR